MAKELPYFKFYVNDWVNGDITLETFELQGLFINICSYYWSKDCELTLDNLIKKFRGCKDQVTQLIDCGVLKIDEKTVRISFLNEQLSSKEVQTITNRKNGQLGGRPKKLETQEKPNGLNFANRNETQTISETKANDNPNITNIKESKVEKSIITPVVPTAAIDYDKFIRGFNAYAGRKFTVTEKVKRSLKARLKKYTKVQIFEAIKNAHKDRFHVDSNFKYLTPEFMLREDKIEKFLNVGKESEVSADKFNHNYNSLPLN